MIAWILILGIPALLVLKKREPALDCAWMFFCSIYLGTFGALSLLPLLLSKVKSAQILSHSCILLVAFFAAACILAIVLNVLFNKLQFRKLRECYPVLVEAIASRALYFCGNVLLFGALAVSLSALPFVEKIPLMDGAGLRAAGVQVLLTGIPAGTAAEYRKLESLLTDYPEHLAARNSAPAQEAAAEETAKEEAPASAPAASAPEAPANAAPSGKDAAPVADNTSTDVAEEVQGTVKSAPLKAMRILLKTYQKNANDLK